MSQQSRRSWLIVPAFKVESIAAAARVGADVVVLDLIEFVPDDRKTAARSQVKAAISAANAGGAEVFAQTASASLAADLDACVHPGLDGIVLSRVESAAQVAEAAATLDRLEKARGLTAGAVRIVAALETAPGNHAAFEIAAASPRIAGITLGRADLIMDLRPEPSGEIHLMQYLMQRLVIVAGAAGVMPIGAWWRAPDRGLLATPENTGNAAKRGRSIGFRGAMCLKAEQVGPLNQAYS